MGFRPAKHATRLIELAQDSDWVTCCIATPAAVEYFLDIAALEKMTEHQVRHAYRSPGDESFPPADAVVVAPATYNTINKWAAGIADTYALNLLAELTGLGVPIAVLSFVNSALAANRVFTYSVQQLRDSGIDVPYGEHGFQPHPPRTGDTILDDYPWHLALDSLQ